MRHFGIHLKNKRLALGKTLLEISKTTAIDVGVLSKIERGERLSTKKQFLLLCNVLEMNVNDCISMYLSDAIYDYLKEENEHVIKSTLNRVEEQAFYYNKSNFSINDNLTN